MEIRKKGFKERLRQISPVTLECKRLRDDLILAFKGEIDLSPSDFFFHPPLAWVKRAHLQITLRAKSSSTKKLCDPEILEQITVHHCQVNFSARL